MPVAATSRLTHRAGAAIGFGILALVLVRLAVAGTVPLASDEAYYWLWSKHLAGAYYDHPPMVAVLIRLGTLIAGDTELGVRLVSVLLGIPATWAVWRAAAILFQDDRVAATAALFFNLTIFVAVGTIVTTPDAPLIVASAFVLFFLAKVHETGRGAWWLAVGAAAGAALLAKYSALFLGLGILLGLVLAPPLRRWLATPWPWLGGLVALALFAPAVAWNADHGWVSFIKQFGRAAPRDWTLRYFGEYAASQFAMATPGVFVLGAMGLVAFARGRGGPRTARVLIGALVWPLAIYFVWHALHSRVEGNWTALLVPAFVIAAAAAGDKIEWSGVWSRVARWSRRLAAPIGLFLAAFAYGQAMFGIIPGGAADPTARQLGIGWPELGRQIDALRRETGAPAVLANNYGTVGWLAFYLPSRPPVVQVNERIRWVDAPEPEPGLFRGPLLFVCKAPCPEAARVTSKFEQVAERVTLSRLRHGATIEDYWVWRLNGLKGELLDRSPPPELRARTTAGPDR